MQLTHPAWNRYDTPPPFYELTVIAERPPAVRPPRNMACVKRDGCRVRRCPYYEDCAENVQRGGAVLCERLIVAVAGDAVIEV